MRVDSDFAGRQILGQRDEQQDAYGFSIVLAGEKEHEAQTLLITVADGMGGYEGGREASAEALRAFVEGYFGYLDGSRASEKVSDGTERDRDENSFSSSSLAAALGAANGALDNLIEKNPEKLEEAGTTLLGVVVNCAQVAWISVGDSPLLLWRKGEIRRLNADHSMRAILAQKIAAHQMLPGDLATHPERNVLRSALLGGEIEDVDSPEKPTPLQAGDILLAATDGLLTLGSEELASTVGRFRNKPALIIAQRLVKAVESKRAPKQDNATVAVVKIR
jgi:serine/threonine protein phosphatase PrpC